MRGLAFVGRDAELADLGRCLEEVERGRTSLVLLVGEAGIGKTRLAEEIAGVAQDRGLAVAWGRSWEAGGAPAYWPWTEALRGLLRARPGRARPGLELGAVLPEYAEGAPLAQTDACEARFRLFAGVGDLLRQLAEAGPMALVLDDLHVADRPSLLLLQFLARALRDLPLLLLGTARERDVAMNAEDATVLSALAREALWLPLPRLSRAQVDLLVSRELEREDPEVAREIWRSSEGNALFVTEMLRLVRSGRLELGSWSPTGGVRSTLERRLSALSPAAIEALEAASVLGRDFDAGLLAAVLDRDADALHPLLLEAEAADALLRRDGERWSFSHLLVREAIYGRLSPARKGRLHGRAADVLERAVDSGEILAPVAHHRVEARQEIRAAQATIAASDEAMNRLAFEEAVHWLERGCDALRPNAEIWCAELYIRLARARVLAGDRTGGREACEQVAAIARRREDPALLARAALACGDVPGPIEADVVRLLEEAAAKLPDGPLLTRARTRLDEVRGLGEVSPTPLGQTSLLLRREGEVWAVCWEGREIRMKDSRGLQILDQLLREPGRAWHVLELVSAEPDAIDRGDAGAVLDASAIQTYKARVRELRADLDEAEEHGDLGRAARLRHELDWLVSELSRGLGLGGRQRVSGSNAEKARVNVQRRLKDAIERIGAGLPEAGRHLSRSVRTGSSCVYDPE